MSPMAFYREFHQLRTTWAFGKYMKIQRGSVLSPLEARTKKSARKQVLMGDGSTDGQKVGEAGLTCRCWIIQQQSPEALFRYEELQASSRKHPADSSRSTCLRKEGKERLQLENSVKQCNTYTHTHKASWALRGAPCRLCYHRDRGWAFQWIEGAAGGVNTG